MDLEGDKVYLAVDGAGLEVVDVSNPYDPVLVGSLDMDEYARDVEVAGSRAFVPVDGRGLAVVDLTQPTTPVLDQLLVTPEEALHVEVRGTMAYVSCLGGGLVMVDISDPALARIVGCLPSLDKTHDLALTDSHVFLADGAGGLAVAPLHCVEPSAVPDPVPTPRFAMRATPNPFNPSTTIVFTLPETGHASLRVFDLAGRLIRVLENGVLAATTHQVTWDGRDEAGLAMASAPYVVLLQAAGVEEKQKVMLVR